MVHSVSRRRFLAVSGLVGGALLTRERPACAIEPFARRGKQILKLGLAGYSLRQFFGGEKSAEKPLDMGGFIDYCGSLGLDGAELTSYFFPPEFDAAYLNGLKRRAHIAGVDISGGAIANNFTLPPGEKLDEQVRHTKTWIDHYAALGAPVIRIFAGSPPDGTSEEEAIRRCVPVIEEACEYAGSRGVMLAMENHDFTTKVERLLEIVRAVKSQWFGVNFDSGNFHSEDPYADMQKIAPYAINAQIKTEIHPAGQERQPADLSRIVGILKDAGYSGYVVLEYEAEEDPYAAIPRHIETLRGLIRMSAASIVAAEDDAQRVLFEDRFDKEVHESWRWLREDRDAWRIGDEALEIRSQPGDANSVKNALVREAPPRAEGRKYAIEVTVTNLTPPTEQYEQLGLTWYHDGKPVLKFVKERIDGKLYVHPDKVPMEEKSVSLRLVVEGNKVVGQFRASEKEDFKTAFEAELPPPGKKDEISLVTYHGPADAEHWMRFDDFRIIEVIE